MQPRRPEAALELVIPAYILVGYKSHFQEGCDVVCGEVCQFREDKVYHEWTALIQAPCEGTPQKTIKRGKLNKKKARKRLKLEGKEYTTQKGKTMPARKPMQWVECKCKNKCARIFTIEDRNLLYERYWSIRSDNERRQYILAMTSTKDPAQRTTKKGENSRRNQTPVYFLSKTNNEEAEVCANVFLSTLQVTRKFVRYTRQNATQGFSKPDSRGQQTPKHKLTDVRRKQVLAHINSFPKVPAHYVRKSSQKIYIEDTTNFSKLTVIKMHRLYLADCQKEGVNDPVALSTYKEIVKSQNIAIHKPKKDQCKICVKYTRSNPKEKAKLEATQQTHISNNKNVMDLKLAYKTRGKEDASLLVFNFDLEAVLYTPCDKVSTIFYMRKLCTYNSTAFNLVTKTGQCYIWDESEGKRGSNEIGTTIHRYLEQFHGKEVVMFSDTCGGQNRNQYIAALLLYMAHNHKTIKSIDYIFMVQGHSHMEVDSMHSAIERKSGGLQIYDPYGWTVVASIARRNPYFVENLEHTDILDLKKLKQDMKVTNVNKDDDGQKVRWNNDGSITWMRFEKEQPDTILYKVTYDQATPFKKMKVIRSMRQNVASEASGYTLPKAYTSKLLISKAKHEDLLKLCNDLTIPTPHHQFYKDLLCPDQEVEESFSSESEVEEEEEEEENE